MREEREMGVSSLILLEKREDSRFRRHVSMTSNSNWSDRTDSTTPINFNHGLGSYFAISSHHRRRIYCREIRPLREKRSALETAGQNYSSFEEQGQRPSRNEELRGENGSGSSSSPRKGRKAAKQSVNADGIVPPKQLIRKLALPRSSPPSATSVEDTRLEGSEEEMELSQPTLQDQVVVPEVIKNPRIPPFFVSPKGDWRQLVALAKLINPSFQSQTSGRFLNVTVGDEVDYRNLSHWLEQTGVEFKSFMLKQDRPVKVVIRGLPSNTEPEDIKTEIEAEGFKVAKISQIKNYRTKTPMPLFYLQIENGADAQKIFDFTELFGTRIKVKPFDRGKKINPCWRCQGWFHSSEVCHLPPRCVRCAGPHLAKDCTLSFDEPMKCTNCSGEHAANW
ncbi:nucleic-acid-binding protein from transposon X-element, partial [Trichonephila clavipes]